MRRNPGRKNRRTSAPITRAVATIAPRTSSDNARPSGPSLFEESGPSPSTLIRFGAQTWLSSPSAHGSAAPRSRIERNLPRWRDRGFGMAGSATLPPSHSRLRAVLPVVAALYLGAYILVALAVTLYFGLAYAEIYWILSGFFLFLLAAGLFAFIMKRRQEAKTR